MSGPAARRRWIGAGLALLLGSTAAPACSVLGPEDEVLAIGTVDFYASGIEIDAPDTVAVGAAFTVATTTYGNGCVRKGRTEVERSARTARLTPYDVRPHPDRDLACPEILLMHRHEARLVSVDPGTFVVEVRGRREPGGDLVTARHDVVVR